MKFFKNNAGAMSIAMSASSTYILTQEQYGRAVQTAPLTSHGGGSGGRPASLFRSFLISANSSVAIGEAKLHLYKGLSPSIELLDSLANNTEIASVLRPNDLLLSCLCNPATKTMASNSSNYTCSFPSTSVATNTGTATWFLMQILPAQNSPNIADPFFFMGAVGLLGSGADLELSEVNLVEGVNYQPPAYNLRILPIGFDFEE